MLRLATIVLSLALLSSCGETETPEVSTPTAKKAENPDDVVFIKGGGFRVDVNDPSRKLWRVDDQRLEYGLSNIAMSIQQKLFTDEGDDIEVWLTDRSLLRLPSSGVTQRYAGFYEVEYTDNVNKKRHAASVVVVFEGDGERFDIVQWDQTRTREIEYPDNL